MDTKISGIVGALSSVGTSALSGLAEKAISKGVAASVGTIPGIGLGVLSQQILKPQKESEKMDPLLSGIMDRLFTLVEQLLFKLLEGSNGSSVNGACAAQTDTSGVTGEPPSNEFLWKPISEKDSKLAILLPSNLTGSVESVEIIDSKGKSIAEGKSSGIGNGNREHFRFSKAGGSYPANSQVLIHLKDGTTKKMTIKDPSARLTKKSLSKVSE